MELPGNSVDRNSLRRVVHTLLNPTKVDSESKRELTKVELRIVNRTRNFLARDFYSVDALELIVSLAYLIKHAPDKGYDTKQNIIQFLRTQKPQFSETEIEVAWNKIEKSGIWRKFLKRLN